MVLDSTNIGAPLDYKALLTSCKVPQWTEHGLARSVYIVVYGRSFFIPLFTEFLEARFYRGETNNALNINLQTNTEIKWAIGENVPSIRTIEISN